MYRAPSPYGQTNPPPRAYSPQPPPQRAYSPQPPMQRAYSPQPPAYPPQQAQAFPPSPTPGSQIVPGSVTYTTSTGPDGRVTYHPFKAVAASYQTPNGVVSGIQWIPAEATHVAPTNAQPASPEFAASWSRGYLGKEDKLKEWQREEDKRRKREEKESAKRLREQQEYRNDERIREYERERRKSFNAGPPGAPPTGFMPFPPGTMPSAGHPTSPYQTYVDPVTSGTYAPQGTGGGIYGRERKHSNASGYDTLSRQFDDMDLNRTKERERKISGAASRSRKHSTSASDERLGPYNSPYVSQGGTNPYGAPYAAPVAQGYAASTGKYSPNPSRPGELPFVPAGAGAQTYPGSAYSSSARSGDPIAGSTTPYGASSGAQPQVYPRGHVMEGQSVHSRSRASSPMPGAPPGTSPYGQNYVTFPEQVGKPRSHSRPPSPRLGGISPHISGAVLPEQQLPPPEGFSRPLNPNQPFTPFDTMKIQDMEEFLLAPHLPRMPLVLRSHDVYQEDWQRLMNDIKLAWSGRLPIPSDSRSGQAPRRTTVVADMIDLWNTSFFLPRSVEVVLYKGRERRSGPKVGLIDNSLPEGGNSDHSESEEEEEEDDESELEEYLARNANAYGRPQDFDPVIIARRRREAREDKRRARKEKEAKRKARAKEREKVYALYMTCLPVGGAVHAASGMPGGYPPVTTTAYVPAATGYGRHGGY